MAFSIKEIRSTLNANGGPARPTMYEVHISPPPSISLSGGLSRELTMLCEKAVLPGRHFNTSSQMIFGMERKVPYAPLYTNVSFTFICDNDMRSRWFFDLWQAKIQQPNSGYFYYYNDYVGTIRVFKLNEFNQATYEVKLEEAYPIHVHEQALSYSSNNSYLSLTVEFAYRRWKNFEDEQRVGAASVQPHATPPGGSYSDYDPRLDEPVQDGQQPLDAPVPRSPHGGDVYNSGLLSNPISTIDGRFGPEEHEGGEHGAHTEGVDAGESGSHGSDTPPSDSGGEHH